MEFVLIAWRAKRLGWWRGKTITGEFAIPKDTPPAEIKRRIDKEVLSVFEITYETLF